MPFENFRDILDHARTFHRQLSGFYKELGDKTEQERVKMLLDYMSRHEKHLEESLEQYEECVSQKVLNLWFQYSSPRELLNLCAKLDLDGKENMTVDEVIDLAVQLDKCLLELYNEMVNHTDSDQVKEVFKNLLAMEKRQEIELIRGALELKEI